MIWSLAMQEVVRFVRRRSTFWLFLFLGVGAGVSASPLLLTPDDAQQAGVMELWAGWLRMAEFLVLAGLTAYLAYASVWQELEGSWANLKLASSSLSRIYLGKLVGIGVCVMSIHCFLSLVPLIDVPALRRPHGAVLGGFLAAWLYAMGFVPEAMLLCWVQRDRRWKAALFRAATVGRQVVPLILLHLAIRPDLREAGVSVFDVGLMFVLQPIWSGMADPSGFYAQHWVPLAILLAWQGLSALGYWLLLVRRG